MPKTPEDKYRSIKNIRDWLLYVIILIMVRLFQFLPRRWAIGLMQGLGSLLFRIARKSRENTIEQLNMAFGDDKSPAEIHHLAKKVFQHFGIVLADVLKMSDLIDQDLDKFISETGTKYVKQAMEGGKGVILLTGHFGNWELLGAWAARNGFPLKVVGKPLFSRHMDKLLVNIRNRAGYTNIARGKATREIIRSINNGEALGMLIDQDTRVPGVFVNFFGTPCHTPVGAVQLAQKFGVDIIPSFMYMKDDLTYQIECQEAITLDDTGNEEEDLFNNTQKCSDAYEQMIRRFPEQWAWMHRRWKKRPEMYGKDAVGSKKVFGKLK